MRLSLNRGAGGLAAKHRSSVLTVASLAGATASDREVSQVLTRLASGVSPWQLAVVEGLGEDEQTGIRQALRHIQEKFSRMKE